MNTDTVKMFVLNGASTSANSDKLELKCDVDVQVNHKNVEGISNICRICATVTDLVIPVFDGEGLQNNLADKIHEHLPIKVSKQDMLPRVVCYQCSSTLLAWHELVQCCRHADHALRQRAIPNSQHNVKDKTNEDINLLERKTDIKSEGADGTRDAGNRAPVREHTETLRDDKCVQSRSSTLPEFDFANANDKNTRDRLNDSLKDRKCKLTPRAFDPIAKNDVEAEVDRGGDDADGEEAHCEFSEQSNVEEFGPLPESVFEAIEDSQECREAGRNVNENETADGALESRPAEAAVKKITNAKGRKTRKCPKCDKSYAASSSYFYHLKYSHNRTKEHECEACGKLFGCRASLSAHGSVHGGDRRHACEECGKRFRTAAGLYIHAQTHSGVKSHGCSSCERSFRWRAHLQRHERRHRGERPHACPACSRAFTVRADLLRHARTHAAGVHACHACGDTFAQPRYLRVHVANKHSDKHDASPAPVARNDR